MHNDTFFFQALVYLTAAVVSVPIAKKIGLGSVLGYLIAGVIIGPAVLGLIGTEGQDIMHFAEFGVVMMLSRFAVVNSVSQSGGYEPSRIYKRKKCLLQYPRYPRRTSRSRATLCLRSF